MAPAVKADVAGVLAARIARGEMLRHVGQQFELTAEGVRQVIVREERDVVASLAGAVLAYGRANIDPPQWAIDDSGVGLLRYVTWVMGALSKAGVPTRVFASNGRRFHLEKP